MSITLAGAAGALSSGKTLKWSSFGGHDSGSITLETTGQRRIFEFLFQQDAAQVAAGSEALFAGLIAAWKDEARDPAQDAAVTADAPFTGSWRLHRIQASGFGGLNQFGGEEFDLDVGGHNWCLEGQNGSGKTALINSVLWALTGQRVREHAGPVIDRGERSPVFDDHGSPIGAWPALAAYPASPADLAAESEAWVRLTFVNDDGEIAQALREMISPRHGQSTVRATIDPRLVGALQLLETSLLMPARLSQMGFGGGSHSLYTAVKRLTGLDQLADIAQGVANQFAHNGRRFLRYAKDKGIDAQHDAFSNSIRDAIASATQLGLDLSAVSSIEAPDLEKNLRAFLGTCSAEASKQLAILGAEIAPGLDVAKVADRERIKSSVVTAGVLVEERTDHVPLIGAWKALTAALQDEKFLRLSTTVVRAEHELSVALCWHRRQMEDRKLRLKALAAEWFHAGGDPACPLCEGPLQRPEQITLSRELEELKQNAEVAERKIADVCAGLEKELRELLPEAIASRLALLQEMEPQSAYVRTMLERFVERTPFTDVLTGFAACVRDVIKKQELSLPRFEYAPALVTDAIPEEPAAVADLRRFFSVLRRLVALADWWREHRAEFAAAFADVRGRAPEGGNLPDMSIRGQLKRLEDALSKAKPYDELAKSLEAAGKAARAWQKIRVEQRTREDIRDALLPLKDLRLLVEVETARSIHGLSSRIDAILSRIHLRERLSYRNASLKKKEVQVYGAFGGGIKIDASLVANTSWLRAILWAFILALREETVQTLGANPLPLLLLDDPQMTFDPRNKRKWAEELARLANLPPTDPTGAQLIVTTHEHEFFAWLTELEKVNGQHGLILPADESLPATVVNGGCLQRYWSATEVANDDGAARQYIAHVRIHAEKLLKLMMRADAPDIQQSNLEKLRDLLRNLRKNNVPPYNRKAFGQLLKCLESDHKALAFLGEAHHSDSETLGVAQARDVHDFWGTVLEPKLLLALRAGATFAAFRGDGRTFAHEPCVVQWPASQREQVGKATLLHTGIAAAAKTGGHAGDGLLMIEEWEAGRLKSIHLPNHEIFRLTAETLEPVAAMGDLIIVSNYANVPARGLVVAAIEDRFLARRYNEMEAHPEIAVLTGQSIDPCALVEPVIVVRRELQRRKVVGTLFEPGVRQQAPVPGSHEFSAVDDPSEYWTLIDGARLFRVQGRSAEPVALDGQYLITRDAASPAEAVQRLDGRLVVAVDGEGTKYFKRLRKSHGPYIVLESLNTDGSVHAELLTLDATINLPRLEWVLPVVGVLFELPGQA